jgi:VWFA-related protein
MHFLFFLALATAGQLEKEDAERAPFRFRLDVHFVEVAAVVTDEANAFVPGLEQDAFEILEDGVRQEIAAFSFVDLPRRPRARGPDGAPLESEVQATDAVSGRLFVLLVDDLRMPPSERFRPRKIAREFVESFVEEGDLVSVLYTASRQRSVGFTGSRETMLEALEPSLGRGQDDSIQSLQVQDILTSLSMVEGVAKLFEGVNGRRKTILYVGPGSSYDLTQTFDRRSDEKDRSQSVLLALKATAGAANRGAVSIYAIDPKGLVAPSGEGIVRGPDEPEFQADSRGSLAPSFAERESLRFLSDETGGFAVTNANEPWRDFDRILDDNSRYYLLAYRPSNTRRDGKDRNIAVRISNPAFRVRARTGYRAPKGAPSKVTPIRAPTGAAREVVDLLRSPVPLGELPLRAVAVPVPGRDPRIALVVEVDLSALTDRESESAIELGFFVLDESGNIESGTGREARFHADRLRALATLPATPGRHLLAVAAHDSSSERSGLLYWYVDVPDAGEWSLDQVVLGSEEKASVPFVSNDEDRRLVPLVPTTRREFPRADTILLSIPPGVEGVTVRVLGEGGDDALTAPASREDALLRLPLTTLTPGQYFLQLRGGDASAGTRTVSFRVSKR